jgi:hypothetical protein
VGDEKGREGWEEVVEPSGECGAAAGDQVVGRTTSHPSLNLAKGQYLSLTLVRTGRRRSWLGNGAELLATYKPDTGAMGEVHLFRSPAEVHCDVARRVADSNHDDAFARKLLGSATSTSTPARAARGMSQGQL